MSHTERLRLALIEQMYADPNLTHRYLHTVQDDEPELLEVQGLIDLTALAAAIEKELSKPETDRERMVRTAPEGGELLVLEDLPFSEVKAIFARDAEASDGPTLGV